MNQIKEKPVALTDELVALRRYFHENPESSLKEYKTAEKIQEELTKLNIPFEKREGDADKRVTSKWIPKLQH